VYNLAVEQEHRFFVGERGVLVHNAYYQADLEAYIEQRAAGSVDWESINPSLRAADKRAIRAAARALGVEIPTPSPYGCVGDPDHATVVDQLYQEALQEVGPGEVVLQQRAIRGLDSARIPDVQIVGEDNITRKVFEAERMPNSNRNVLGEAEYERLGREYVTRPLQ
jgi:hypothetical protein